MHVGCNVYEIQYQKEEHQCFQETAKVRDFFLWLVSVRRLLWSHLLSAPQLFAQGTYEYGCQLLTAALALRQSCKLPTVSNSQLSQNLWNSWKRLQSVGQEQMTRLRVSAVYHRSVEEVRRYTHVVNSERRLGLQPQKGHFDWSDSCACSAETRSQFAYERQSDTRYVYSRAHKVMHFAENKCHDVRTAS